MSELIKRADLLDHLNKCLAELGGQSMVVDTVLRAIKSAVEEMPTVDAVDAVEVVRCKDCALRACKVGGQPNILCWNMHEDDFCSYGERRNDD